MQAAGLVSPRPEGYGASLVPEPAPGDKVPASARCGHSSCPESTKASVSRFHGNCLLPSVSTPHTSGAWPGTAQTAA